MISKEEIRRIPELSRQIRHDRKHLEYLKEKATSVGSVDSGKERVQTSPDPDQMKYADAAIDLEAEIIEREKELLALQTEAERWIRGVRHSVTKKVLRYRYLSCYSWNQVADITGYSRRWIRKLEKTALEDLQKSPTSSH